MYKNAYLETVVVSLFSVMLAIQESIRAVVHWRVSKRKTMDNYYMIYLISTRIYRAILVR